MGRDVIQSHPIFSTDPKPQRHLQRMCATRTCAGRENKGIVCRNKANYEMGVLSAFLKINCKVTKSKIKRKALKIKIIKGWPTFRERINLR